MSVIGRKWALNANFKWRSFKITEEGDFDKNVFKLTKVDDESDLREARIAPLLVKLGLKDAEIIDKVFFTSSFSLRKGGRKTRRKRQKKRKRRTKSHKFRSWINK